MTHRSRRVPARSLRSTASMLATVAALASLTIAAGSVSARGVGDEAQSAFRDARGYTVRVRARVETPFLEDNVGSFHGAGFLIDAERGWIVTNAHVVARSPSEVEVAFQDGDFVPASKLYVDGFADVAVLALPGPARGRRVAVIEDRRIPEIGEPIGVFGHPLGALFTGTRGIVSNHTDQAGADLVQIDATVDHGNSGGPVIALRDGRVVGIATAAAGLDKSDRMNFATPMAGVSRILAMLRRGQSPCPVRMEFALLRNDEGRHTLEVAATMNPGRWPFEPGDRIVSVEGEGAVSTLTDLVDALRGRGGVARLVVGRDGAEVRIEARPELSPSPVDRAGIIVDGALIAPLPYDDGVLMTSPPALLVQSVARASEAEELGIEPGDMLHTVDGRAFATLAELLAHLRTRDAGRPIRFVLTRWSDVDTRLFDFELRELRGSEISVVGPLPDPLEGKDGRRE